MDKISILKMIYEQESAVNQMDVQNISLEDLIQSDRKLKKVLSDLESEQLVQYIDSKIQLTHMGKYLAKTL